MRRILVSFVGKRWEQLFWPYQHLNFPGETARDVTMAMIIGRAIPIGKITKFTSPPVPVIFHGQGQRNVSRAASVHVCTLGRANSRARMTSQNMRE